MNESGVLLKLKAKGEVSWRGMRDPRLADNGNGYGMGHPP